MQVPQASSDRCKLQFGFVLFILHTHARNLTNTKHRHTHARTLTCTLTVNEAYPSPPRIARGLGLFYLSYNVNRCLQRPRRPGDHPGENIRKVAWIFGSFACFRTPYGRQHLNEGAVNRRSPYTLHILTHTIEGERRDQNLAGRACIGCPFLPSFSRRFPCIVTIQCPGCNYGAKCSGRRYR